MPLRVTSTSGRLFAHITAFLPQTREVLRSVRCAHEASETQRNELSRPGWDIKCVVGGNLNPSFAGSQNLGLLEWVEMDGARVPRAGEALEHFLQC